MKRVLVLTFILAMVTALAAPVTAKPPGGDKPGKAGALKITVATNSLMWANSVGDEIAFDITVTTTRSLSGFSVVFGEEVLTAGGTLGNGESWTAHHAYTVDNGDLGSLDFNTSVDVVIGVVEASGVDADGNTLIASADVPMTAYRVPPCPDPDGDGSFTFGPNPDWTVCAFTPNVPSEWTLTTTLPKPKKGNGPISPAATVRDGVPGNWCNSGEGIEESRTVVIDTVSFPPDGVCLRGGAGGDTIPVRNATTFYLATWEDNVVHAEPSS